jgi:hypothetical protein
VLFLPLNPKPYTLLFIIGLLRKQSILLTPQTERYSFTQTPVLNPYTGVVPNSTLNPNPSVYCVCIDTGLLLKQSTLPTPQPHCYSPTQIPLLTPMCRCRLQQKVLLLTQQVCHAAATTSTDTTAGNRWISSLQVYPAINMCTSETNHG